MKADKNIKAGMFLIEYVGEVLNIDLFGSRFRKCKDAENVHRLREDENNKAGTFLMEYVGEVLYNQLFKARVCEYEEADNRYSLLIHEYAGEQNHRCHEERKRVPIHQP